MAGAAAIATAQRVSGGGRGVGELLPAVQAFGPGGLFGSGRRCGIGCALRAARRGGGSAAGWTPGRASPAAEGGAVRESLFLEVAFEEPQVLVGLPRGRGQQVRRVGADIILIESELDKTRCPRRKKDFF